MTNTTVNQVLDSDLIFSWFEELSDTHNVIRTIVRLAEQAKVPVASIIEMLDLPREIVYEVVQDKTLLDPEETYDEVRLVYPIVALKDNFRQLVHPRGFYDFMIDEYELSTELIEDEDEIDWEDSFDGVDFTYKVEPIWVDINEDDDDVLNSLKQTYPNIAKLIIGASDK